MKKLLSVILAIAMILAMSACGSKPAEPAGDAPAAVDYPTRAVAIDVCYGAGGGQDVFTRLLVKYMLEYMPEGSNIVVNNVTGGGGVIGATQMANAKADGYELGSIVPWQLTDQFCQTDIPYTEKSFVPLCVGSYDCNFIVVGSKWAKANNISDWDGFIEYVKAHPGEVTIGMGGNWNVHDFFRLRLEQAYGIEFSRVSYDGGAGALAAVMSGDIVAASNSISEALSAMESGEVIALVASSPERPEVAPEIPTLKELGCDMSHGQWRAITCPPGTPQEVQDVLVDAMGKALADEGFIKEAKEAGLDPVNYAGQAAIDYVNADFGILQDLVNSLGITPDYEL